MHTHSTKQVTATPAETEPFTRPRGLSRQMTISLAVSGRSRPASFSSLRSLISPSAAAPAQTDDNPPSRTGSNDLSASQTASQSSRPRSSSSSSSSSSYSSSAFAASDTTMSRSRSSSSSSLEAGSAEPVNAAPALKTLREDMSTTPSSSPLPPTATLTAAAGSSPLTPNEASQELQLPEKSTERKPPMDMLRASSFSRTRAYSGSSFDSRPGSFTATGAGANGNGGLESNSYSSALSSAYPHMSELSRGLLMNLLRMWKERLSHRLESGRRDIYDARGGSEWGILCVYVYV